VLQGNGKDLGVVLVILDVDLHAMRRIDSDTVVPYSAFVCGRVELCRREALRDTGQGALAESVEVVGIVYDLYDLAVSPLGCCRDLFDNAVDITTSGTIVTQYKCSSVARRLADGLRKWPYGAWVPNSIRLFWPVYSNDEGEVDDEDGRDSEGANNGKYSSLRVQEQ
jgi:hypothetical protein